jgi:hypothetical protein
MICTPGAYKAKAVGPVDFQKSSQKETPAAVVQMRIEDGPHKGTTLSWSGWLSDKAKPRTIESLVLMGFDGEDPNSVTKKEVIAVLDNEAYEYKNDAGETKSGSRARINFINDPERSVGFTPLSDAERAVIAGDIRASVQAHKAAITPPPTVDPAQLNVPKPKF